MKKLFTSLFAALAFLVAQGQITVTFSDFGSIGDEVPMAYDTLADPGQMVGAGGAAQTWTFTNFNLHFFDTVKFLDPAPLPNSSYFPSSNMAITSPLQTNFVIASSSGIQLDGISLDLLGQQSIPANLNENLELFQFPLSYQQMWVDTALLDTTFDDTFTGIMDSLRGKRVQIVDANVDGHGMLTTVNGTYDVLRLHTMEVSYDTAWGLVPILGWQLVGTQSDTIYRYSFIANGEDYPVLEVETTAGGEILAGSYRIGDVVIAAAAPMANTTCNGTCDGSAGVLGIGGSTPYSYVWDDPMSQTTATATGLCAGNYMVTVTDGGGGTSIAMVDITEPPAISINTVAVDDESHLGNDGQIAVTVAGGSPGYSYVWSNGETTQNIDELQGGAYTLTVTDNNGCTDSMSFTLQSAVGIEGAVQQASRVTVWPIPANETLNIDNPEGLNLNVELYSLLGEVVYTGRINGTQERIALAEFTEGVYFLKVGNGVHTETKRLLITH